VPAFRTVPLSILLGPVLIMGAIAELFSAAASVAFMAGLLLLVPFRTDISNLGLV